MKNDKDYPVVDFETQADWEAWLEDHHALAAGVWIKLAKKNTGIVSINYDQAVEGALCFGWIDGQARAFDDQYWLQKFTPRRTKGSWSKINVEKAEALIAQGRMRPAGLRQVEQARADGRWAAAYEPPSRSTVPDDLQAALDANPAAQAFFNTLDSANRYAVLYRIQTAKKPATRAATIQKMVALLARGEKIHR